MKLSKTAVCIFSLAVCLYLACNTADASPSGSVQAAMLLPDGSPADCEGVVVARIATRQSPAYFVVSDFGHPSNRIVVLCRPAEALRSGQTIEVSGYVQTLPTGERYIANPTVYAYYDNEGRLSPWVPVFPLSGAWSKQVLSPATGPVPPLDPSLTDNGLGMPGAVSAETAGASATYDTIGSLLAAAPPVLSGVVFSCKPIKEVGDGFILVADDHGDATVRVYTNAAPRAGDRIVKATGTVHSEGASVVVYADSGPAPYFDPQASSGEVLVARPGTVAYASTLNDATASLARHGARVMGVGASTEEDGAWVYLTGQVVTYGGQYFSYEQRPPPTGGYIGWVSVCYVQGVDRRPGIRVWNILGPTGAVVDIMAKVDTKDGQRTLGIWSSNAYQAEDLTSPQHSIEPQVLAWQGFPPNLAPLGVNNRILGGGDFGNNPGVTGGSGLNNVGSYVTILGRALEVGDYCFDEYNSIPYFRIDDGAGVPSGNCNPSYGGPYGDRGVTVFGTNSYDDQISTVAVGDLVGVTGVSSVWQPSGPSDAYRCIWTWGPVQDWINTSVTRQVTSTGTISGVVKLYDMPESTATVSLYCSNGKEQTLTIQRQNGSGSATYTFTSLPKTVQVSKTDLWGSYTTYESPQYILSAQSDGFKTRTYTGITPGNPTATVRNLYVVPLRKIYLMTSDTQVEPYPEFWDSTVVTATVVNSDHDPIPGVQVRFRTNKGSFSNTSVVHETAPTPTNANGEVAVRLYGVPSEWDNAILEATDDSAPLAGDVLTDDPYNYDWTQLHNSYGQPITITMNQPTVVLGLQPGSITGAVCENQKTLTAALTVNGAAKGGQVVTFYTSSGVFVESGTNVRQAITASDGTATATLSRPETCAGGEADVHAVASLYGITADTNNVHVVWQSWKLNVTVSPDWVVTGTTASVQATLTLDDGTTPVAGKSVTLTTNQGHFTNNQTSYTANTNSSGQINTTLTVTACPVTATVIGTAIAAPCNCSYTDSDTLLVICNESDAKTLIIALDGTSSMDSGAVAADGLSQLMQELKALGKALKVGAVRFGDYVADPIKTPNPDNAILTPSNDYEAVSYWILNATDGADGGGDFPENDLQALVTSKNVGGSGCYIALATDNQFHYAGDGSGITTLTESQVISLLSAANCKVYIDPRSAYATTFANLAVNGAIENSLGSYRFPKLELVLGQ